MWSCFCVYRLSLFRYVLLTGPRLVFIMVDYFKGYLATSATAAVATDNNDDDIDGDDDGGNECIIH